MFKKQKQKWRKKMSKREECRKCGAKLRHDKTSDQYDPEYCSGKCRKEDGSEPYVKTAEEQAAVVEVKTKRNPASYEDYKKNVGAKYARRYQPERLNWSPNKMNEEQLKQAGFRANREPIPDDFDYEETVVDGIAKVDTEPSDWELLKNEAKDLGISIFGKTKEQLLAEVKEANDAA
jgi:hypothetical protein